MLDHEPGEHIIFDTSGTIAYVTKFQTKRVDGEWHFECLLGVWDGNDSQVCATVNNDVATQIFGNCGEYMSLSQTKQREKRENVFGKQYEFRFKVKKCSWDKYDYECIDAFCVDFINYIDIE